MIKPTDMFIGLRDFFGFLMPGAIFCMAVILFGRDYGGLKNQIIDSGLGVLFFLSASYCSGHVFNAFGAFFIDRVYDQVRPFLSGQPRSKLIDQFSIHLEKIKHGILYEENSPINLNDDFTPISFWIDYLRLTAPIASAEIDRVESIEKFLRSLTASAIFAIFLFFPGIRDEKISPELLYSTIIALVSFALFVKFRLERVYRVLKLAVLTSRISSTRR